MDFFMRNFKKITIGWLLLVFVFWLVPRVCFYDESLLVDYAPVTFFYVALFVIAIISFIIIVLIEVISTKNYKWLGKLFVVLVVPVMLLAVTDVYRWIGGIRCVFLMLRRQNKKVSYMPNIMCLHQ